MSHVVPQAYRKIAHLAKKFRVGDRVAWFSIRYYKPTYMYHEGHVQSIDRRYGVMLVRDDGGGQWLLSVDGVEKPSHQGKAMNEH